MHEASIAAEILDVALRVARDRGADAVTAVRVRIGALQAVVPEALAWAFDAAKAGTAAQAAALAWDTVSAEVQCSACGAAYAPADIFWECPACGAVTGRVLRGNELEVIAVTLSGIQGQTTNSGGPAQ